MHVVLEDAPDAGVMLVDHAAYLSRGHAVLDQQHDVGFHKQREAGARPAPWRSYGLDAVLGALDPRLACMQERAVLEEIEVAPSALGGVVDLATGPLAIRAIERAAGREIEPEVELLVLGREVDLLDGPRSRQTQSGAEQSDRGGVHRHATSELMGTARLIPASPDDSMDERVCAGGVGRGKSQAKVRRLPTENSEEPTRSVASSANMMNQSLR